MTKLPIIREYSTIRATNFETVLVVVRSDYANEMYQKLKIKNSEVINVMNPFQPKTKEDFKKQLSETNVSALGGNPVAKLEYMKPTTDTCKENAGAKNMTAEVIAKLQDKCDDDEALDLKASMNLIMFERGMLANLTRGPNWDAEDFILEVRDYFEFAGNSNMRINKFGLCAWLGCSTGQFNEWMNNPAKYGHLATACSRVADIMANDCVMRGENSPAFNIFMLKAAHGMQDRQELTINNNGGVKADEINDVIAKMGLDK